MARPRQDEQAGLERGDRTRPEDTPRGVQDPGGRGAGGVQENDRAGCGARNGAHGAPGQPLNRVLLDRECAQPHELRGPARRRSRAVGDPAVRRGDGARVPRRDAVDVRSLPAPRLEGRERGDRPHTRSTPGPGGRGEMKTALATLLLGFSVPALGAQKGAVRRGELVIRVRVSGTVVPDDVFRLKSTIEGRIESISASTYSWRGSDEPLAMLTHKEL